MSDYVCTYTVDRHRCGRPGAWNGRAFRCAFHEASSRQKGRRALPAPSPDPTPELARAALPGSRRPSPA